MFGEFIHYIFNFFRRSSLLASDGMSALISLSLVSVTLFLLLSLLHFIGKFKQAGLFG